MSSISWFCQYLGSTGVQVLTCVEFSETYKRYVTKQFLQHIFSVVLLKSLRSSVSEGIRAVDERMCKQEDIRKKKVSSITILTLHAR